MSKPFCPENCDIYPDEVKGACDVCINSENEMYAVALMAIAFDEPVYIDGEGKEGYHIQGGGWVSTDAVEFI
jgi:hypothetical protein